MPLKCQECPFRNTGLLQGLPERSVGGFSDRLQRFSVRGKNSKIVHQGQQAHGWYFVCRGLVGLSSILRTGDEVILDILGPCSVFAARPGDSGSVYPVSAVTLLDTTEIAYIDPSMLIVLFEESQPLALGLVQQLTRQLYQTFESLKGCKLPVLRRVLVALQRLTQWPAENTVDDTLVTIPLPSTLLAQYVRTRPETLSRILTQLRKRGLVQSGKGGVIIVNRARLAKIVNQLSHLS